MGMVNVNNIHVHKIALRKKLTCKYSVVSRQNSFDFVLVHTHTLKCYEQHYIYNTVH